MAMENKEHLCFRAEEKQRAGSESSLGLGSQVSPGLGGRCSSAFCSGAQGFQKEIMGPL